MEVYEIGLAILRKCKDDLEVESFIAAFTPFIKHFPPIHELYKTGANGVQLRLALLAEISESQEDIIVSANQLKEIDLLFEQVVVFEIAQRLAPGVGLALRQRLTKHDQSVFKLDFDHMKVKFSSLTVAENEKVNFDPAVQLMRVFKLLFKINNAGVVISGKVNKYSIDMICCGIQLGFGRISNGMFASRDIGLEARSLLLAYLDKLNLSTVFRELILIQSQPDTPGWCKSACGKLLSRMLNRSPNALTGMIDGLLGVEGCLKIADFHQLLQLSQVVIKPPQNCDATAYYAKLVGELKELLSVISLDDERSAGPNVSKFLSILLSNLSLVAPSLIRPYFHFPTENQENTILTWWRILSSLPLDAQIPGMDNVIAYLRNVIYDLFHVAIALRTNQISPCRVNAISILAVINDIDYRGDELRTAMNLAFDQSPDHGYDYQLNRIEEPIYDPESNAAILFEIIIKSETRTRSKAFIFLLETYYSPDNSQIQQTVAIVLAQLLTEDASIFGLCLKDEDDLIAIVKVVRTLLEKVHDVDSLQLTLAIVAMLLSDLSELKLKSKELIREELSGPVKAITENDSFESEEMLIRTAKDLYEIVMTLGQLKSKEDLEDPAHLEPPVPQVSKPSVPQVLSEKMTIDDWSAHLFDSQIPLRAGALRELTAAVKSKSLTKKLYPLLKKSALESIKSADPFLFLSGVEALSTLALNDRALFNELMELFQTMSGKDPTVALQFGEILARVCCQLGDMAASYAKDIIPILLATAARKNVDPLIVASAISAASSILPLTGFFLHDIQVRPSLK